MYPVSRRGTIMAWFNVAIPVGSALGFVLGGQMLNISHMISGEENWRWGFYAVVPPGILLAIVCFFMRELPRGQSDEVAPHHASMADYGIILRTPSFIYATAGYTALTFVLGGVAAWMPTYVSESRHGASEATASTIFGAIVVVAGLVSTILGGLTADKLRDRVSGAYLLVSGWGVLLSFPFMLGVILCPFPYAWIFVFLAVFAMFFNTGPVNTVMANVTHPSVRASAFALNILFIHLFGDAISPPIMGALADLSKRLGEEGSTASWLAEILRRNDGWDFSMGCTSLLLLAAGVIWLWGARFLDRDTALAPQRIAHKSAT
jgi:MFS family permease